MDILKLKNIPIIFESHKALPVVYLKLVFKASGVIMSKPSLANLAALLLNEGTKKLGSNGFAKLMDQKAINIYANANFETFSISLDCLKEHFDFALDLLKNLLEDPNLSPEILEKCKKIALGDLARQEDDNDFLASRALFENLYKGSPLEFSRYGNRNDIQNVSLNDIKNHISMSLKQENLFMVFGGDILEEDTQKLESVITSLSTGQENKLINIKTSDRCESKTIKKQSEQAYLYFGSPYIVSKDDKYKALIANFTLGSSGFGSRLMEEIRVKRGLAYSIYANGYFNLSHSHFFGYMQTKNENLDLAKNLICAEIDKFINYGINNDELDSAKKFILGSQPLKMETLFKRLSVAGNEFYEERDLGYHKKELEYIKSISLNEINKFISDHNEIAKLSFGILSNV